MVRCLVRACSFACRDDCEAQTKGFPGATHKKFKNPNDAAQWLATHGVAVEQPAASSSTAAKPARPSPIARPPPQGAGTKGRVKPGNGSLQGKDVIQDTTGWQLIYSDGACRGNGQVGAVAGVGVWHGPNDKRWVWLVTSIGLHTESVDLATLLNAVRAPRRTIAPSSSSVLITFLRAVPILTIRRHWFEYSRRFRRARLAC